MTAAHAVEGDVLTAPVVVPLLDERAPFLPPVTRRTMTVAGGIGGTIWLVGLTVALAGPSSLTAVGAGLMLPGGGHLASGHLFHGAIALLAVATSVFAWWMTGAFVAPFVVWGLDLAATASMGHHGASSTGVVAVAAVAPAVLVACLAWHGVRHHRRRLTAARLNRDLARAPLRMTRVPSRHDLPVGEASLQDLERLRFALDLALQPLDAFEGFDRRDQFREAALRYQLCILGYALSAYRYNYAPAFAGYATEAQSRAIQKMSDRRVWGYWAIENAWGRLSLRRDPVDNTDNVMLTGWQGVAVGMFETLDDARFSEPGALTYTWSDDERYPYDFPALARSIEQNMRRSPFTLFSCEPRWIYPVCNTFGVNTLLLHQRLHDGTGFAGLKDRLRTSFLEEFHRPDGRVVGVRSETLGLSWSPWAGDGVWLPTTYWMHAGFPEIAHRSWWLMRETVLRRRADHWALPPTLANRCDSGSYAFGRETFGQILLAMAAREIGDEEVAGSVLRHLDETEEVQRSGGASRYADVSTQGNLYELMARFGRESSVRDLIGHGMPETWRTGPRLADAAYPDVLVARAVTDGSALSCVLHPGDGGTRTRVVIDRARPGARYLVRGAIEQEVTADSTGELALHLDLVGRTELTVEPAP